MSNAGNVCRWHRLTEAVTITWIAGDHKGRFAAGTKKPAFTLALTEAAEAFELRAEHKVT